MEVNLESVNYLNKKKNINFRYNQPTECELL